MKIIHLFHINGQKFYKPFIELINSNFRTENHLFIIVGKNINDINFPQYNNVLQVTSLQSRKVLQILHRSKKIILHSLFVDSLVLLFICPWLASKSYWAVWGGDLYYKITRKRTFKSNTFEMLRKCVIKRIGGIVTYVKGDYELAQKWYNSRGKFYYSCLYPSNLYKDLSSEVTEFSKEKLYIQIGNSADNSNNHIEVLDKLARYKDNSVQIICPLSYGDKIYAQKVVKHGERVFGAKFVPLLDFVPSEEYTDILRKVNVAIFNHSRQQAMGNIITLLGLGKKVYIRNDITTWQFCKDKDLKIYSASDDFKDIFESMDTDEKNKNIEIIKNNFSEEKLISDWTVIFK